MLTIRGTTASRSMPCLRPAIAVAATALPLWVVLTLASVPGAMAEILPGNPARGESLVRQQCVACHAIGTHARTDQQGPPLTAVARMPSTTSLSLHAFLLTPHPSMPNYKLNTQEVDDVVSFILSLRSQ